LGGGAVTRREWLAISVLAPIARAEEVAYRNNPPYVAYRQWIEGGHDEFGEDPVMAAPPPRRDGWFADLTGTVLRDEQLERGIPYWIARLDAGSGIDIYGNNGIAVGDVDGDGRDEIYVCQPAGLPNRLFGWSGGRLVEQKAGVELLDDTSAALFLDVRNVGRQDLIILRGAGPLLYLNDGAGRFRLAPDAFRFAKPPQGAFTGMAAADYDRDGKLDLYLCTYSFFQSEAQFRYPVPYFDAQNGPANFLFRNRMSADGTGYFEDVTRESGMEENNNRYSFAPAWADVEGTGWPSLYVANDFGRNNFYRNEGGKFRDVAAEAGVEDIGPGMSACWFDESGRGRPDLYVANMWTAAGQKVVRHEKFPYPFDSKWEGHTKGNSFYRNQGKGKFHGEDLGIAMGRWGWAADAADFDNDGQAELFLTCGMMTGPKQPDLMGFFWRQVVAKTPSTAVASGPYENGWNAINQFIREGYCWNGNEANVFYVKEGERYRDASVESGLSYVGDSRAFAITDIDGDGCLDLVVKNRLAPQVRVFQNRVGQGRQRMGFRLRGTRSNRDAIGARVMVEGRAKWVTAGSGYLSQHTKTLYFGLGEKGAAVVKILWPSGLEQELGELAAGALYDVREGEAPVGRPFAKAAAMAAREAPGDNTPRLRDTWLLDPVPLPEAQKGPGLFVLEEATGDRLATFTLFRRYLFEYRAPLELPLSLLLNDEGHAVKIYAKPPGKAEVAADLARMRSAERPRGQGRRDYFKLGASLLWCGYREQALPYLEAVLRQQPGNVRTLTLVGQIHREAGRLDQAVGLLEEALRIDPAAAEAWNELGGVSMARKDYGTALQHFGQALEAKSGLPYVLLNAAQAAEQLGKLEQAERYYREVIGLDQDSAEGHQGLGLTMAKRGQLGEATKHLEEAVRLRPAFAAAWNNLGVLYLQRRDVEKAIRTFEQGIAAAPADEMLYLNLGRVYVQTKQLNEARATMERLLRAKPDSRVARKALEDLANAQP
jgi:tetratricopeptide (TPR) repeat protein